RRGTSRRPREPLAPVSTGGTPGGTPPAHQPASPASLSAGSALGLDRLVVAVHRGDEALAQPELGGVGGAVDEGGQALGLVLGEAAEQVALRLAPLAAADADAQARHL